jgi:hypothetical protein
VTNVTLRSNVHLRQRGVEARHDRDFRWAIFSRQALFTLIPELRPGPAGVDRALLRAVLGPAQVDYFNMLNCQCGRQDYWYVLVPPRNAEQQPNLELRVRQVECMCRRLRSDERDGITTPAPTEPSGFDLHHRLATNARIVDGCP